MSGLAGLVLVLCGIGLIVAAFLINGALTEREIAARGTYQELQKLRMELWDAAFMIVALDREAQNRAERSGETRKMVTADMYGIRFSDAEIIEEPESSGVE